MQRHRLISELEGGATVRQGAAYIARRDYWQAEITVTYRVKLTEAQTGLAAYRELRGTDVEGLPEDEHVCSRRMEGSLSVGFDEIVLTTGGVTDDPTTLRRDRAHIIDCIALCAADPGCQVGVGRKQWTVMNSDVRCLQDQLLTSNHEG